MQPIDLDKSFELLCEKPPAKPQNGTGNVFTAAKNQYREKVGLEHG